MFPTQILFVPGIRPKILPDAELEAVGDLIGIELLS